jgi:hypothetical protein
MVKVIALLLVSLLSVAFGGSHQNNQPNNNSSAEKKEKAEDKLDKYVKVTITPVEYNRKVGDYVPTAQFKVGAPVRVGLTMTNTADATLNAFIFGTFMHNRPRLLKDGKPMQYLADVPRKLKASDDNEGIFVSTRTVSLEPNRETRYGLLDLSEWYGQFQPGHYELTIRHRFHWKGKLVESNTVEFEVVQ